MDSIPIAVFVFSYLFAYIWFIADWLMNRILLFSGFFIYTFSLTRLTEPLIDGIMGNGGMQYQIAISYLFIMQGYNMYRSNWVVLKQSVFLVMIFIISLFSRQIDLLVCETIGFGTHFIWHILNALVLYGMVRILYKSNRS